MVVFIFNLVKNWLRRFIFQFLYIIFEQTSTNASRPPQTNVNIHAPTILDRTLVLVNKDSDWTQIKELVMVSLLVKTICFVIFRFLCDLYLVRLLMQKCLPRSLFKSVPLSILKFSENWKTPICWFSKDILIKRISLLYLIFFHLKMIKDRNNCQ